MWAGKRRHGRGGLTDSLACSRRRRLSPFGCGWSGPAAASYAYSLHAAPNDLAPDGRLHSSYTSAFFAKVKRAELHKVVQQPWPLRVLHRLQSMDRPS